MMLMFSLTLLSLVCFLVHILYFFVIYEKMGKNIKLIIKRESKYFLTKGKEIYSLKEEFFS